MNSTKPEGHRVEVGRVSTASLDRNITRTPDVLTVLRNITVL